MLEGEFGMASGCPRESVWELASAYWWQWESVWELASVLELECWCWLEYSWELASGYWWASRMELGCW